MKSSQDGPILSIVELAWTSNPKLVAAIAAGGATAGFASSRPHAGGGLRAQHCDKQEQNLGAESGRHADAAQKSAQLAKNNRAAEILVKTFKCDFVVA